MSDQEIKRIEPSGIPDPMAMMMQAKDAGFTPEQIGQWMDLQERFIAREARVQYAKAMADVQAELPPVVADKKNSQTNSVYGSLENILEVAKPILGRHGMSITYSPDMTSREGYLKIIAEVMHAAGHAVRFEGEFPLDGAGFKGTANKTPIQAWGSTCSYARRYLFCMIFNIAVADQDKDGNSESQHITPERAAFIREKIANNGIDLEKFLGWLQVKCIDDIPANRYSNVIYEIDKKISSTSKKPAAEPTK